MLWSDCSIYIFIILQENTLVIYYKWYKWSDSTWWHMHPVFGLLSCVPGVRVGKKARRRARNGKQGEFWCWNIDFRPGSSWKKVSLILSWVEIWRKISLKWISKCQKLYFPVITVKTLDLIQAWRSTTLILHIRTSVYVTRNAAPHGELHKGCCL